MVDEVRHLDLVEALQPGREAGERLGVLGAARARDLVAHRLDAVAHVDRRAVGVDGAVGRVEQGHRQLGLDRRADRAQGVVDETRHRHDRRAGVEDEALLAAAQAAATGSVVALDERHLVPPAGEVAGGGEAREAGPDDDDAHASLQAIDRASDRRASDAGGIEVDVVESGEGEVDLVGDALLGLLEHAGVEHELLEHLDVGVGDDRAVPEVALGDVFGQEAAGLGEQHGGLAPQQVVADGLAGALRVAPDAEHVVAQGEGLTEVPAEGLEGGQGVGARPGRRGRRAGAAAARCRRPT